MQKYYSVFQVISKDGFLDNQLLRRYNWGLTLVTCC